MNKVIAIIFNLLTLISFGQSVECIAAKDSLVKTLTEKSNTSLFGGTGEKNVHKIWQMNQCAVISILKDKSVKGEVRFLAAEILLENKDIIPFDINKKDLANLYAKSLLEEYSPMGLNYWGMNDLNDVWYTGKHFIKIGKEAIPVFATLLDNDKDVGYCCGTKGAWEANGRWEYRIKDVAAFFILKILGEEFVWSQKPEERDVLIKKLKKSLGKK